MKSLKKLWLMFVVFVIILSSSGCAPQNSPEHFTRGLVDLLLQPVQKINPEEKTYTDDLMGSLRKLMDTRSFESEMTFEIEKISGLEESLGSFGSMLSGASLEFTSAYDVKTGDGVLEFNGLGLVNGTLALHESQLAADIPQFLQDLMILEYESTLDYEKNILLEDRMQDLFKAVNPDGAEIDLLQPRLEALLYKYADLIATKVEKDQLEIEKDELEILGETQKVQKVSLNLDEDQIREILQLVLETAKDDDELYDLIKSYIPNVDGASDPDEIEDELRDSIESALDNLDDTDLGGLEIAMEIYFLQANGLFKRESSPVAINLDVSTDEGSAEIFYKWFTEERQFDVEFKLDAEGESVEFYLLNVLEKDAYQLEGELSTQDGMVNASIEGSTQVGSSSELGEYELTIEYSDGVDAQITVSTELSQVKKGSEYEFTASVGGDVAVAGQEIGVELGLEGTNVFSAKISIDLPDFDDPDAERYDDILEFFEAIQSAFGNFL